MKLSGNPGLFNEILACWLTEQRERQTYRQTETVRQIKKQREGMSTSLSAQCTHTHTHTHTDRERERERERVI